MSKVLTVLVICMMIPPGIAAQTFEIENRKDGEIRTVWSDRDTRVEVRYRGNIVFTDDDRDIREVSRDGYFLISEERRLGNDRRLELRPASSGSVLNRRYTVDSRERTYDADGEIWLADILLRVIRDSGIAAEARVARILRIEGPRGVLNEISLIEIDHVQRRYFQELLSQASPTGELLADTFRQAGQQIGSDHELARLLRGSAGIASRDALALGAYFDAAKTIGSDYELRQALAGATRETLPEAAVAQALRTAVTIGSDFELASLLIDMARPEIIEGARSDFFAAVQTIGSDYEQRRVLSRIADLASLSPDTLTMLVRSTAGIGSDYEAASVLTAVAGRHALEGPLREAYLDAASSIGSDHEQNRALNALLTDFRGNRSRADRPGRQ